MVDKHHEVAAKCHHVAHNQSILLIPRVFLYQKSTRKWDYLIYNRKQHLSGYIGWSIAQVVYLTGKSISTNNSARSLKTGILHDCPHYPVYSQPKSVVLLLNHNIT